MRISIFGFGNFGQLITKHLVQHTEVLVYDRNHSKTDLIKSLGATPATLQEATVSDVIILAVTLDVMKETLEQISPLIQPGALVADVTSVKVKPAEMMQRILPAYCQILATHPLFGPQTASESLRGQKIVLDPIRVNNMQPIESFLQSLGLELVYMTAEEHDREMAWVHALTFFVGRGLLNIDPPKSHIGTNYYGKLMEVVDVERTHSMDLFYTIQRGNPYADEMRQKLIDSLSDLEQKIKNP